MTRRIHLTFFAFLLIALTWATQAVAQCPAPGASQPTGKSGGYSQPTTLSWTRVSDAMYYRLEVTRNGKIFHREWFEGERSWTSDAALAGGDYTYRVRTWNPCGYGPWSTSFSFTVSCNAGSSSPNQPAGNAFNNEYRGDFSFSRGNVSDAWFNLWIERNGTAYRNVWLPFRYGYGYAGGNGGYQVGIDEVGGTLPCGQYQWKVRAWADCYGTGQWSWTQDFTVNCCTGAPIRIDHIDLHESWASGTTVRDPRPHFDWTDNDDAPWYNVYLEKDGKRFAGEWTRDASWGKKGDLPPGDYAIAVRGWNKCGMGEWSDPLAFTIECSGPDTPTGLHRTFGYGYGRVDAAVGWNGLTGTYWYQLDVRRDGAPAYSTWLDFSNPDHPLVGGSSVIAFPGALARHGDYDYRVRAWNRCGMTPWSDWDSYSIDCALTQPMVVGPVGVIPERNPMLTWVSQTGVEQYRVYTARNGKKWVDAHIDGWESLAYDQGTEANTFASTGAPQGWRTDDGAWYMPLPFNFPFFGTARNHVYVNSNGALHFDGPDDEYEGSMEALRENSMIAVLRDDLITDGSSFSDEDIYIDVSVPNEITFRWQAEYFEQYLAVNCSTTLYADGRIRLRYGSGNRNGGLIGISSGDGRVIGDTYHHDMGNADDIVFTPSATPNLVGVSPGWDMPDGNYSWYVQPMSDCFGKGPWSARGAFTIDGP